MKKSVTAPPQSCLTSEAVHRLREETNNLGETLLGLAEFRATSRTPQGGRLVTIEDIDWAVEMLEEQIDVQSIEDCHS